MEIDKKLTTISTTTENKSNSVEELINTLKQANPESIVRNHCGKPVTAYIDPVTFEAVIIED